LSSRTDVANPANSLLNRTIEYFKAGHILPIRPIKTYPASSILEAFRYMQQGLHMGKIVISMRDASGEFNQGTDEKRQRLVTFDPSASYLLVGGLGGLGRSISTWMIDRGARHLIYLSRSANSTSEEHQDFLREVESMGCKVELVQGSVSSADDVRKAVDAGNGNLKGILQMSMVLCDRAFTRMTLEEWNTATAPKIEGTWNLHNSTLAVGANLDFFVLFSSISGVIGQPGQANYAGANTFLDAFVQYRTALGLPGSVVDIGAVQEVGYVANNEVLLRRLKTSGAYGIVSEQGVLDSMAAAMTCLSNGTTASSNGRSTFICRRNFVLGLQSRMSLRNPDNRAIWKKDVRMAQFHNHVGEIGDAAGATNDVLKSFLAKARHDAALLKAPGTATLLTTEIGKKLFSFLLKPEEDLDISASLATLGMDSLVAIEMRTWWKQTFGFDISVLEMLGMGTLEALGKHAAETLRSQLVEGSEETGRPEAELSK
jgi:acyl carrier protein